MSPENIIMLGIQTSLYPAPPRVRGWRHVTIAIRLITVHRNSRIKGSIYINMCMLCISYTLGIALMCKFNQKNTNSKTSNAQSLSKTLKGFYFNLPQFLA